MRVFITNNPIATEINRLVQALRPVVIEELKEKMPYPYDKTDRILANSILTCNNWFFWDDNVVKEFKIRAVHVLRVTRFSQASAVYNQLPPEMQAVFIPKYRTGAAFEES